MSNNGLDITRRKILGTVGAVGVASAGAGLGTTAFFSDTESFDENRLTAGSLDLKVDWEEHYYDASVSVPSLRYIIDDSTIGDGEVGLPDPDDPVVAVADDELETFMNKTSIEAFPDPDNDGEQEVMDSDFTYQPCTDGADLDEDLDPTTGDDAVRSNNDDTYVDGEVQPLINLDDVKPGDFGEVTFSFHLCDNPGYVWLRAGNVSETGGANPEPEVEAEGDSDNDANLAEEIKTVWWYDSRGDNVLQTDCPEKLYLSDSGIGDSEADGDEDPGVGTRLFEVTLNDNSGEAELTQLVDLPEEDYERVDSIATTPQGDEIVAYDKDSGRVGTYDIMNDAFMDEGQAVTNTDDIEIVLAGYSPDGTLWAVDQVSDELYTIDRSGPSATAQGDTGIDILGADIAFSSDGTMYIWTNDASDDNTDTGLYKIDNPAADPTAEAVDVDNIGLDEQVTGLAIRDAGTGNLVASDTDNDEIIIIDRTDGSVGKTYDMAPDGDTSFASGDTYGFGDMTAGQLCGEVFHRGDLASDLEALSSGNGFPLDGNRATQFDEDGSSVDPTSAARECFADGVNHYIGFAWWLPRGVGNKVQGDTVSFDLGFYTEQCRHNDGATS